MDIDSNKKFTSKDNLNKFAQISKLPLKYTLKKFE